LFKRNCACAPIDKRAIVGRTAVRRRNLREKLKRECVTRTNSSTLFSHFVSSMFTVHVAVDQRFRARNSSRSRLRRYEGRKKFNLERDNMQIFPLYKTSGCDECDLLSRFGCRRRKLQKHAKNAKNRISRNICGSGRKIRSGILRNRPQATFFVLCT
jgi:hypothetical protein